MTKLLSSERAIVKLGITVRVGAASKGRSEGVHVQAIMFDFYDGFPVQLDRVPNLVGVVLRPWSSNPSTLYTVSAAISANRNPEPRLIARFIPVQLKVLESAYRNVTAVREP